MKTLKINSNWRIDSNNEGSTLIFSEKRIRTKKETGIEEEYLYEDSFYYANVEQCLESFLRKTQEDAKDVKECIEITQQSINLIKSLL